MLTRSFTLERQKFVRAAATTDPNAIRTKYISPRVRLVQKGLQPCTNVTDASNLRFELPVKR